MSDKKEKTNWFVKHKVLTGLIVLFVIGVAVSGRNNPTTDTAKPTETKNSTTTKEVVRTKEATVFDVPTLLGKNIDEVRVVLGTPDDKELTEPNAQQLALGVDSWDNTFTKGNDNILVTFNPTTRKVIDYFLSGNNENGENKQHLIDIGNLNEGDSKYEIKAVKVLKDPSKITGIIVTPN